jgi:hypothetical protein
MVDKADTILASTSLRKSDTVRTSATLTRKGSRAEGGNNPEGDKVASH